MAISKRENRGRGRRARRIRKKVFGTAERPRLCVHRSLKHIYAQLVDDEKGVTIVQAGSAGKGLAAAARAGSTDKKAAGKSAVSKAVGELIAEKAKEKGVTKIVFDRKGYLYHGRVKALADAARSKGLIF
jgi:large subunit ribosomal protein L18